VALYKTKRYREARIKFEELYKIGNNADQRSAERYFDLIEKALDKEKQRKEAEQRAQEERFLQERRAQAKMDWERGKIAQQRQHQLTQKLSGTERDKEIEREQQIRTTEEENAHQRRMMLEKSADLDAQAEKKDRQSRDKYIHEVRAKKLPIDVTAAENKEVQHQAKADELAKTDLIVTDTKTEAEAKAKEDPQGKTRKERRRLDQLESSAQRERRLKEEEARHRVEKEEQRKRQVAEKWAKEKKSEENTDALAHRIEDQKEKFKKDTDTDAFIRRNQEAVEAILKEDPLADQPVTLPAGVPAAVSPAVTEQKRLLDDQRALIRKDFEDGVERLYAGAVELFKKKLYEDAKSDFIQVDGLIKGYKKTAQYLKDIDRALAKVKPVPVAPVPAPVVKAAMPVVPVPSSAAPEKDRTRVVADMLDTFDVNTKQ
jgi:hypothetical protein